MRSGWPSEDGRGTPPANQGQVPFDAHPYTAFDGNGYGDDGYDHPAYQGQGGYEQSNYLPAPSVAPHRQQGYAGSSYAAGEIEMAYPASADAPHQPWDYEQPLRYDDEEVSYRDHGRNPSAGYDSSSSYNGSEHSMPGVNGPGYDLSGIISTNDFPNYGRLAYDDPRYDDAPRNPNPPVSGPQPVQRRSETRYDMQRYDENSLADLWQPGDDVRREAGYGQQGPAGYDQRPSGWDQGSSGWGEDPAAYSQDPSGYGHSPSGYSPPAGPGPSTGGYGSTGGWGASRPALPAAPRPALPAAQPASTARARAAQTRYDMKAVVEAAGSTTRFDMKALSAGPGSPAVGDHTRFDVPKFDETRLDNMKAPQGLRVSGGIATASPHSKPRSWAGDTSLDQYGKLDLRDEPVSSAFGRPDSKSLELPSGLDDETHKRGGKRRGRSNDRRQWMALGAIAIVAAGAIGGVLVKHVFSGSGGPAHTIAAPNTLDGFTRSASLEQQNDVAGEAMKFENPQTTDVKFGAYQKGTLAATASAAGASGANAQVFVFIGGKLSGSNPSGSIAEVEKTYPGTTAVPAGAMGGDAACGMVNTGSGNDAMCVWFDNDTFGALLSPSMTTATLANTMDTVRPSLELKD